MASRHIRTLHTMRETTALYSLGWLLWTRSAAAHARSTGIRMTSRIPLLTTSPPNRSYCSIERCGLYNTYWGFGGLEDNLGLLKAMFWGESGETRNPRPKKWNKNKQKQSCFTLRIVIYSGWVLLR